MTHPKSLPPGQTEIDYELLASQWVRALRGKRSRSALSSRLGYKSNVVHRWEAGTAWPTAAVFLAACERLGHDVRAAYADFFHRRPDWLGEHSPSSSEGVAAFLRQLRGKTKVGTLAAASGFSRYSVARWLDAENDPKLPQFLALVEASSRRALDFIAEFHDPGELPSVRTRWERLQNLRRVAYASTWSHAVLRALELEEYERADDVPKWLGSVLGIGQPQVERALGVLEETGQIERCGDRWIVSPAPAVSTGRDPRMLGVLTKAWTDIALERLGQREPGHFGYSLFAVSRADMQRLRDLHAEYLREMQSLIAQSTPNECVGLLCLQLLDLRRGDDNALGG